MRPNQYILETIESFDWDEGNTLKNVIRHGVTPAECEQVFFNHPILFFPDEKHSAVENRYSVLGKTSTGRRLYLCFTLRDYKARIISARDQNKKERTIYGQAH